MNMKSRFLLTVLLTFHCPSDLLNVGQMIYAIGGSQKGFENTITDGIVNL